MPSVAYRLDRQRVRDLDEAVDDLMQNYKEAQAAWDAEDLVRAVLDTANTLARGADRFKHGLRPGVTTDDIARARAATFVITMFTQVLLKTQKLAAKYRRLDYSIAGFEELQTLPEKFASLRESLINNWKIPDEQTIQKAKQDIADGKFRRLTFLDPGWVRPEAT